ncbi:MAG: outer membrane protein assembly factor BamB family protein [Planctomycetota bacterium]|jgi:outer membrane protein assembly factor BamB
MKATNPWYRSAVATAIVGGVFSVIILTLIVLNYVQVKIPEPEREIELENLKLEIQNQPDDELLLLWIRELDLQSVVDPNRAEELGTLKAEIRGDPDDEQLLSRIRQLDLQVKQDKIRRLDLQFRQNKIRRRDFSRKGSYLLLGSVAVLLIGVKLADTFRKKTPAPQLRGDEPYEQVQEAMRARWAVTAGLVILAAGVLFLITGPRIDFTEADVAGTSYPSTEQINKNWPGFRGPSGLGISAHINVPTNWNGKTGEGILWKTNVPLLGFSSPVIWGDRVFLSGGDENKLQVYCFGALSGRLLWTGDVAAPPKGDEELDVMEDTGFAAPTMVTDGRRVYAIFVTGDVGCFDFSGRKVWARNLGIPDSAYGYASSLAMYRNLLLIQYDQGMAEDQMSKLIALNAFSGRTVWEMKRPVPNSWTSPIVVQIGNQHQLITCGDPWVIAYDPANGAELWRADCLAGEVAPSPIYANGLVFAIEPYTKLVAIRSDGRGDVTETHIAWSIEDGTPDISSPVSNGELIFLLTTEGLLMCYKVTDGTKLWEKELEEYFFASPSLIGDLVYLLSEEGVMFIVEAGPEYKELTRCELGEECRASPAFADGRIYIRGPENLYCIGQTTDHIPQTKD